MRHESAVIHFDDDKFDPPAEVCWTCSDPRAGRWVPVCFCDDAWVDMQRRDPWPYARLSGQPERLAQADRAAPS